MFIGHLPAGYCLTKTLLNGLGSKNKGMTTLYFWIGLIASVLPDMDILYFYFIDHRQHGHHSYWTHIPVFWIAGATVLILLGRLAKRNAMIWGVLIGLANVLMHLCLDSIASKILWLFPISKEYYGLFHVPSKYGWWVWNYIFHWTFTLEVMVVIIAVYMVNYAKRIDPVKPYYKGTVYAGDHINR